MRGGSRYETVEEFARGRVKLFESKVVWLKARKRGGVVGLTRRRDLDAEQRARGAVACLAVVEERHVELRLQRGEELTQRADLLGEADLQLGEGAGAEAGDDLLSGKTRGREEEGW